MRNFVTAILLLVTALSAAQFYGYKDQPVPGQSRVPAEAAGEMRIEQKLGAMVPKDVRLVNEECRTVRLEELLGKKPTILTFVFYDCTSVCLDILFNLTKELKGLKTQEIGREYRVITVSIKPTETPAHARSAKIRTLEGYPANRRTAMTEDGWHFLVGEEKEVRRLADAVGFKYTYDAKSDNVVHAMYLPDFRAQYHVVPGRYTQLHFTATKPGTYKMFCAIHCGTQHSEMVGYVHVLPQAEFDAWMANGGNRYAKTNLTMAEAGKQIWDDKGCGNCHQTLDNERAPSVVGIYGSTRKLADGTTAVANEDYLRESILRPWNRLTEGYERTMQAYDGVLSEEQVLNLVAYMKSLGQGGTSPVKGEYQQPVKTGRDFPVGRKDPVDIANERGSAGASQAHDLRNNP